MAGQSGGRTNETSFGHVGTGGTDESVAGGTTGASEGIGGPCAIFAVGNVRDGEGRVCGEKKRTGIATKNCPSEW